MLLLDHSGIFGDEGSGDPAANMRPGDRDHNLIVPDADSLESLDHELQIVVKDQV